MPPKTKEKVETATSTYELGDVVLGKIRGYPPWPGQVVNPENVPKTVAKERPSKKSNFYCIRFLPTGDYGWIASKDISRLQKHEIEAYISEPSKKNGDLLKGYKSALDPASVWEKLEAGIQEAEDEAEVDQLESDADEGSKPKAKKRKRDAEAAEKKPAKSRAKKEPAEKKKPAPRARGGKSKDTVESEDEAGDDKPAAKKTKVDDSSEQVKSWRHKLQKCFLSKDKGIKAEDMDDMDKTFTAIENFNMSVDNLSYSKIGKVMRHIAKLEASAIPHDDKHSFRDRASALVETWSKFTGRPSKGSNGDGKDDDEEANGKADEAGDLTMMDADAKDGTADADGEADAEAEAEPSKEANGDAEMADA